MAAGSRGLAPLLDWARHEAGIEWDADVLELRESGACGVGGYAKCDIRPPHTLFRVPRTAVLDLHVFARWSVWTQIREHEPELPVEHILGASWMHLLLVALRFVPHKQAPASVEQFRVYVQSLPDTFDDPTHWHDAARADAQFAARLIAGTNLHASLPSYLAEVDTQREAVLQVLRAARCDALLIESATSDRWRWARSAHSSRCFPPSWVAACEPPTLHQHQTAPICLPFMSTGALVPVLDLLNHAPRTQVAWDAELQTTSISLRIEQNVEQGAQVFNNYGAKANEQLLLAYGFAEHDNPADLVRLRFAPSLSEKQRELVAKLGVRASDDVYHITADGGVPHNLVRFLRVVMLDDSDTGVLEEAAYDPELEDDVRQTLRDMLARKVAKIEENEALAESEPLSCASRYARIYVEGQLRLLKTAIARLEAESET